MSKPTHILISIEDIKKQIRELSSDPIFTEIKRDIVTHNGISRQQKNKATLLQERIGVLQDILDYKQISLSEEDIEEKAEKSYDNPERFDLRLNGNSYELYAEGYKQALKDLL